MQECDGDVNVSFKKISGVVNSVIKRGVELKYVDGRCGHV